jgi:hypothetical protein
MLEQRGEHSASTQIGGAKKTTIAVFATKRLYRNQRQ